MARTYVPAPETDEDVPEPENSAFTAATHAPNHANDDCEEETAPLSDAAVTPDGGLPPPQREPWKENNPHIDNQVHPLLLPVEGSVAHLLELLPPAARRAAGKIPVSVLRMDPLELRRKVKPSPFMEALRTSFWAEYHACTKNARGMNMARVYGPIISQFYWNRILENPVLTAFVMTPPADYHNSVRSLLRLSLERMHEIMNLPLYDKKGNIDVNIAKLVLKAHEVVMYREMGAPVQKSLSISKTIGENPDEASTAERGEISARMSDMKVAARDIEAEGEIIDEFTAATISKS